MKRLSAALIALCLTAAFLCTAVAKEMQFLGENVVFTRTASEGDETLLEGVSADIRFTLDGYINWDVEFTPLGKTQAWLSFSKIPEREYYSFTEGIGEPFKDIFELAKRNEKLAEYVGNYRTDLAYGEAKTYTVRMSDYYEYYPMRPSLNLEKISIDYDSIYDESTDDFVLSYRFSGISGERGRGFLAALEDFLKIPVYSEDVRSETVTKSSEYSYSFSSDYQNSYSFNFNNAVFDDMLYFTVTNRIPLSDGSGYYTVDTSEIPGGYGIYSVPLTENDVKYEQLKTVYRLEDGCSVYAFGKLSSFEDVLYLAVSCDGKYVIRFIDRKTMTDISEIQLFDLGINDAVYFNEYEDFIVFYKNSFDIKVVKRSEDGGFSEVFATAVPEKNNMSWDYFPSLSHCAFDGERLVIFTEEMRQYFDEKDTSLTVEIIVLTRDGVGYYGKWENSLGSVVLHWQESTVQFDGYKVKLE